MHRPQPGSALPIELPVNDCSGDLTASPQDSSVRHGLEPLVALLVARSSLT